jgi:adenosylcobinamide-GDP ribazoletransferase
MFRSFLVALSFLTIVPIRLNNVSAKELQSSIIFYPLVGLLEGLFLVLVVYLLNPYFSSFILSFLLLISLFLIRGIFHADGLSDTFDALFYKGTGNNEQDRLRRLEIMKDSTVGVGGVYALVLITLAKLLIFNEIISQAKNFLLLLSFILSRFVIIILMRYSKPAKNTGLGALFVGKITTKQLIYSSLLPVVLILYFITVKKFFLSFAFLFIILFVWYLKSLFERKFGGITGDNLGTTVELTEVFFPFIYIFSERLWQSI